MAENILIVGLGNIGAEYEHTRHNIGFSFVDYLSDKSQIIQKNLIKFNGVWQKIYWHNYNIMTFKPLLYMNRSGGPVKECLNFYKIPIQNMIVIFDDLDQETGALKLRFGGGHGGHNGIRDILANIFDDKFHRLKIGIGRPTHKSAVTSWVLSPFTKDDLTKIQNTFITAEERLLSILKSIKI